MPHNIPQPPPKEQAYCASQNSKEQKLQIRRNERLQLEFGHSRKTGHPMGAPFRYYPRGSLIKPRINA